MFSIVFGCFWCGDPYLSWTFSLPPIRLALLETEAREGHLPNDTMEVKPLKYYPTSKIINIEEKSIPGRFMSMGKVLLKGYSGSCQFFCAYDLHNMLSSHCLY